MMADDGIDIETQRHIGNLVDSAIHVKDKAKEKTKSLLSPTQTHEPSDDDDEGDIFSDAAFDPARVLDHSSPKRNRRSTREAIREDLKSAKYLAVHPQRVMRSKATHVVAGKIGKRQSFLTAAHDEELLAAHDALSQALSANVSDASDYENAISEIDEAQNRVEKVEQQRASLQTAWILGRHVSRVKVVRPMTDRPRQSQFHSHDRFEWERYLGYMALYYTCNFTSPYIDDFNSPPFDLEDLARIIERIAITSAPWQAFFVNVREVYTWRDPRRTAKWLALFCVLWYTQHIIAYFYFWVIYRTMRNRFRKESVRTVRESVGRAIDRETRVQAWGELIQRHGKHEWLEPFLDDIGPMIQLQLGDLADLLEILINFHRWETPNLTMATLFFYCCCLAVALCADMEFCMKLVWFIAGGAFFLTYPIASNFPKYRLLLSHWRWPFWGIPTHAELAILRLQEKAATHATNLHDFGYLEDDRKETEIEQEQVEGPYTFKVYNTTQIGGRLTVTRNALIHVPQKPGLGEETWQFSRLHEMRKLDGTDVSFISTFKNLQHLHTRSAAVLQFLFLGDHDKDLTVLMHPADRDRVFNLVLAWSGLKWQCLAMERHNPMDSDRGNLDRAVKRAFH